MISVELVSSTFQPQTQLPLFQLFVDRAVAEVNSLIPGDGRAFEAGPIPCYIAPASWNSISQFRPPITLLGHSLPGEPVQNSGGNVRIALHNCVLPGNIPQFVFQFSHELGHIVMDPRFTNHLIETFAVAISLVITDRLGWGEHMQRAVQEHTSTAPPEVAQALNCRMWSVVTDYLIKARTNKQAMYDACSTDYQLETIGACLLRNSGSIPWTALSGAAEKCSDGLQCGALNERWTKMPKGRVKGLETAMELLGL